MFGAELLPAAVFCAALPCISESPRFLACCGAFARAEAILLVFLDGQMPGLDGLEVVRELLARNARLPYIIFGTAGDQYAVEAVGVNAAAYLLKPGEKRRLDRSIRRARELLAAPSAESERMAQMLARLRTQSAPPPDVIFATVRNGAVRIVATELEGCSNYKTPDDLHSMLGDSVFWRTHRSHLVNISRIKAASRGRARRGDPGMDRAAGPGCWRRDRVRRARSRRDAGVRRGPGGAFGDRQGVPVPGDGAWQVPLRRPAPGRL